MRQIETNCKGASKEKKKKKRWEIQFVLGCIFLLNRLKKKKKKKKLCNKSFLNQSVKQIWTVISN